MTLRQTLQAAPTKANELIGKLAETSNQAVKARETMFAELSRELSLYADVEEQHLVPLLRRHSETKSLAADVAKTTKQLRTQLAELEAAPKDDNAFLEKLAELKKGLKSHIKDERNEILPAVLKVLNTEEANGLADNMQAAVSEADDARREEKSAATAEAKRRAAEAGKAAEQERAAARSEKAAERVAANDAAEASRQGARLVEDGLRESTKKLAQQTQDMASAARGALTTYRSAAEEVTEDVRAVSASSRVGSKGLAETGSAWMEWARKTAALNVSASRQMIQCRTIAEVAEAQREYMSNARRVSMEGSIALLETGQRVLKQALDPLQARLNQSA
jgi:hemerythrin-like domain-containing protein